MAWVQLANMAASEIARGLQGRRRGGFGFRGPRRTRRRKGLTASDLREALTIASAISKKAAENYILTRVRT